MNVLLINGSPHKNGCTFTALSEVAAALNANGIETTMRHIGTAPIAGCIACGKCRSGQRVHRPAQGGRRPCRGISHLLRRPQRSIVRSA